LDTKYFDEERVVMTLPHYCHVCAMLIHLSILLGQHYG